MTTGRQLDIRAFVAACHTVRECQSRATPLLKDVVAEVEYRYATDALSSVVTLVSRAFNRPQAGHRCGRLCSPDIERDIQEILTGAAKAALSIAGDLLWVTGEPKRAIR